MGWKRWELRVKEVDGGVAVGGRGKCKGEGDRRGEETGGGGDAEDPGICVGGRSEAKVGKLEV